MSKYTTEQILQAALDKNYIKEIPNDEDKQIRLAQLTLKNFGSEDLGLKEEEAEETDPDKILYNKALHEEVDGIKIQHQIEGEIPELPVDLNDLSDKQVMYLYGAFNAMSARVGYLHALSEGGKTAAESLVQHYEEKYLATADRKDHGGKVKAHYILKAEAIEAFPQLTEWKRLAREHSIEAGKQKRMFEILNQNCERLSRHWTMRMDERSHA